MNAITEAAVTAAPVLNIGALRPSATHVQAHRRARYTPDNLQGLAESIRTSGVLQPILVRPVPPQIHDGGARSSFEIVAGERRWRAASLAGLTDVPVTVRELDDTQVLEAQLVENLQREDLDPMSEAEGFNQLMEVAGLDADQVAEKIGKSRSTVYARVKLLDLSDDGRAAVASGQLDASRALLVARIRDPKMQAKALELALQKDYQGEGPRYSYRDLLREIGRAKATVPLGEATFPTDDPTLAPGPCTSCEFRTGNCAAPGVVESADVCTDVRCFKAKTRQASDRRLKVAEEAGLPVFAGEEAEALAKTAAPVWGNMRHVQNLVGYVDIDARCEDDEYSVKAHGIELSAEIGASQTTEQRERYGSEEWARKQAEARERLEKVAAFRMKVAAAIFSASRSELDETELTAVATTLADTWWARNILPTLYGGKPAPGSMTHVDRCRYIRMALLARELTTEAASSRAPMLDSLAKRFSVDVKAIKAEHEGKPVKKAPAEKPKPKTKAKTKVPAKKAPAKKAKKS